MRRRSAAGLAVAAILAGAVACSGDVVPRAERVRVSPTAATPCPGTAPPAETPVSGTVRPAWLGTRVLPLRSDGFGEVHPTPPELRDRRFPTIDLLPPPPDDAFHSTSGSVPPKVVERSTWRPGCPVPLEDLRYLTVSFWGFDGRPHTGEMVVHASAAEPILRVFRRLHEARFPIEEMRVIDAPELDAPPTGDGNVTTAFVCRPTTGATSWSQHAYGLAVDVNPFHNPYVRGDLVLPELASAYADRAWERPGMVTSEAVDAFRGIGWAWGGDWRSPVDPMHFSATGN